MANEFSRPWEGETTGDAGPYSSTEWQTTWANMIGYDAANANYGVLKGMETELEVTATSPASTQITVKAGAALVQGIWYQTTTDQTFSITANASGNSRIDLVVLQAVYNLQTLRLAVITGTPAASPAIPGTTQSAGVQWEIPLARILVNSGFATITQADITDMRQFANLPPQAAIAATNTSASILDKGAVVIRNTAGTSTALNLAVTTTTTFNDAKAIGIIESRAAATSGEGRVITQGITPVTCTGAVAVGDYLYTSTTAGQATNSTSTTNPRIPWGVVLVANSGAGTNCLAYVNFSPNQDVSLLRHPDYDSGWFAVAVSTTYTKAHGLGVAPRYVVVFHSTTSTPAGGDELVRVSIVYSGTTSLDFIGVDSTNVYDQTGSTYTAISTRRLSAVGFHRIQAWK